MHTLCCQGPPLLAYLLSTPVELMPNATRQPRPEAGAQRTLEGVGWTRWLGAGEGKDPGLTRLLHGPGASPSIPSTPS
jgi:hypothetical protein